jgi:hypothetical protein
MKPISAYQADAFSHSALVGRFVVLASIDTFHVVMVQSWHQFSLMTYRLPSLRLPLGWWLLCSGRVCHRPPDSGFCSRVVDTHAPVANLVCLVHEEAPSRHWFPALRMPPSLKLHDTYPAFLSQRECSGPLSRTAPSPCDRRYRLRLLRGFRTHRFLNP